MVYLFKLIQRRGRARQRVAQVHEPHAEWASESAPVATYHGFRCRYEYWNIRFKAPYLASFQNVVLVPTVNSWMARFWLLAEPVYP